MRNLIISCPTGDFEKRCTLFTAKMLAMDYSDKNPGSVDILDGDTGEILVTYEGGSITYSTEE